MTDVTRWIHVGLAYGLLAVSAAGAAFMGAGAGTVPLVVLAAAWIVPLIWLFPRRDERPALVCGYYVVLDVLAWALVTRSAAFAVFASVGYLLAFAILPARLAMIGVTGTAVLTVVGQMGPEAQVGVYTVIGGIAVPLVFAGWYVAAESDKRRELITELRTALAENAELHARLLEQAREAGVRDERQRMSGEIHDTIAQDLVALTGQLRAADRAAEETVRRRHLDQAATLAARGLAEARRSVRALRPEPLENGLLPEAITRMARTWGETADVALTVEVTGTPVALAPDLEVTLFRVAQEALANVAKHAGAARAGVTLSYEDSAVLLDVRDDGRGFDPESPREGFGLDGMRQRVHGVGGTLEVESEPGQGTAVAVSVPAIPAEGGR
ncbi:sensor histidine kinase [Nonomuraea sediminis]|uniref:sensor histidine kinase n=1 Tax=Nonomuraea sediminis TaxID=2835864 RepID=UPI001BDC2319|nr:sensor histidine kinase [Nonomuraea sediminis]